MYLKKKNSENISLQREIFENMNKPFVIYPLSFLYYLRFLIMQIIPSRKHDYWKMKNVWNFLSNFLT